MENNFLNLPDNNKNPNKRKNPSIRITETVFCNASFIPDNEIRGENELNLTPIKLNSKSASFKITSINNDFNIKNEPGTSSNLKRLSSLPLLKKENKKVKHSRLKAKNDANADNLNISWSNKLHRIFSKKNSIKSICIETNQTNSNKSPTLLSADRISDQTVILEESALIASEKSNWCYLIIILICVSILAALLILFTRESLKK